MDQQTIIRASQIIGVSTAFTLFGLNFCSSQLVIPLLPPLSTRDAAVAFRDFYHTGAKVFVPMAIVSGAAWGTAAYLAPAKSTMRNGYIASGIAMIGTGVFTATLMLGVNERLVDISHLPESQMVRAEVLDLLAKWKVLNFVRSGICFVGGLVGMMSFLD